ncbi:aromatic ring-hydroxylating oxygenase subunit alpha [Paenibacillus radicis (ex Xue et al. 2023)]|uniref:Aromatic ring-hydroxylating dioxygenase subunit alpha n=1 Tax=Paenibacillus radicis (ex Xue et al. 2023) TaxID=2972489 RepID=A0ABT1YJJ7_9BACL|nr:aromatic ring-hydroxylating dioxygenase subunit alpha [Paenibacillus radicis (ex Xue et al. 2023)]MCR8633337.1 aromatic ring-hydroxylating dioxygenase subunit alpha [Paenibacillus radicis (ex Xue et al. 2023)]
MYLQRLQDPVLENDWHAVYLASELRDQPIGVIVLGERVAIYRTNKGVHAVRDLCIHRGAMLSKGRIEDEVLVCPYHGWKYDTSGQCVCIPAQPKGEAIPSRAKVDAYGCVEKYGFIWVCIGEPAADLPHFEEFDSEEFRPLACGPYKVNAAGTRVIENFTDFAHLMFVHQGLLGHPDYAELPDFKVNKEKDRIYIENIPIFQPVAHSGSDKKEGTTYVYMKEVYRPLSARLSKADPSNGQTLWIMLTVLPVTAEECLVFMVVSRNYGFDVPDENFIKFQDIVFDQDARIIETQKPELLPLDLQVELNHRVDLFSVAYRRWLNELGVVVGTI